MGHPWGPPSPQGMGKEVSKNALEYEDGKQPIADGNEHNFEIIPVRQPMVTRKVAGVVVLPQNDIHTD